MDAKTENEDIEIINGSVVWRGGIWHDGNWRGGEWEDGTWRWGTWLGGNWKGGYVLSKDSPKSIKNATA